MSIFESDRVIQETVSEATLRVYDAGFDQGAYRLKSLSDVIFYALPEFALGYSPKGIPDSKIIERVKSAAEIFYNTDNFKKRGEFGELVLHLLLRDFCGTTPLVSKIYFKDSANVAVHGFDAIHVTDIGGEKSLWLGEAKIHHDAQGGIMSLNDDLKKHFKEDYLRKEFLTISQKIAVLNDEVIPDRDYWLDLMHKHTTLDNIFQSITVPMLCVYDSGLYKTHTDATDEYAKHMNIEIGKLRDLFNRRKYKITTNLNVVLMLFPVPSKEELLNELHARLKNAQGI